jgi:hypothetical protein
MSFWKRVRGKEIIFIFSVFVVVILVVWFFNGARGMDMDMEEKRDTYISLKKEIIGEQITQGNYKCCLEKPCTYCIEKTPGHGEGAICSCVADLMNGVHPCGECIGEIMEGHGNPYLSEYFANAIAEKVGGEHIETLMEIMEEKYGIPVEDQKVF